MRASLTRAVPLGLVEGSKAARFYVGLLKCLIIRQFFESRFRFFLIILDALILHHSVWVLCFGLRDSLVLVHRLACGIFSSARDGTHFPCIERWILNHWATREVPGAPPEEDFLLLLPLLFLLILYREIFLTGVASTEFH